MVDAAPTGPLGSYPAGQQQEAASGPQQVHSYGVTAGGVCDGCHGPGGQASDRGGSEGRGEEGPAQSSIHGAAHRGDVLKGASTCSVPSGISWSSLEIGPPP